MSEPIGSFDVDEGYDAYGTHTKVKFENDQIVKIKSFDAKPLIEQCKAERLATEGEKWGEMRKVGTIPMAIYSQMLTMKDQTERTKFVRQWLKQNTAFITFDRYAR